MTLKSVMQILGVFVVSFLLNVALLIGVAYGFWSLTDIDPHCRSESSDTVLLYVIPIIANLAFCLYFYKRNKMWAITLLITMFIFVSYSNIYLKRGCSARVPLSPVDQNL